ncbi:MAG: serine hydrolase domain-containing protein [Cyclobacteriaceae bacterium]
MKHLLLLTLLCLIVNSCQFMEVMQEEKRHTFADELADLKAYYQIPGMAVMVMDGREVVYEDYIGKANIEAGRPVTSGTHFPIASITKLFSAVLVHRLHERGKLNLTDAVNKYLDESTLNDSIQIQHLLSHTSEGRIGEQFHYSSRFALLTQVIEKSSGRTFSDLMRSDILVPTGMNETYLPADASEAEPYRNITATGYRYDGTLATCAVEYGYSASAGIVSSARDLARFQQALLTDSLLLQYSKELIFTPFKKGLPYGQGIFTQELMDEKILWAYGQYDCYSSLLIMVPEEDLTFILLANNNLTSDPARLINGDVTTSLFAVSFLKNFVYGKSRLPLLETESGLAKVKPEGPLYRRKLLAQAMAEAYMSRYDTSRFSLGLGLLDKLFTYYPKTEAYASLNLMHTLSYLNTVAQHHQLTYPAYLNDKMQDAGSTLLQEQPDNPYLHIYLADYYDRTGDLIQAAYHYRWLAEATAFSDNWYTAEAKSWLEKNEDY